MHASLSEQEMGIEITLEPCSLEEASTKRRTEENLEGNRV